MPILVVNNYHKPEYRERAFKIAAAMKELGRRCEIFSYSAIDEVMERIQRGGIEAVVLSGSSAHINDPGDFVLYKEEIQCIPQMSVPLLGICFGHQLIAKAFGSEIGKLDKYAKGFKTVEVLESNDLFSTWRKAEKIVLCKSHRDFVMKIPNGFTLLAQSEDCEIEAFKNSAHCIFRVQAHVERYSDKYPDGLSVLGNFIRSVIDTT